MTFFEAICEGYEGFKADYWILKMYFNLGRCNNSIMVILYSTIFLY